ncbi:MAG: phosphodiester glycosidase family protein [Bacilli bacterium]|nr:phosphodiester glycosidase family protein [Bacilli bacterium]
MKGKLQIAFLAASLTLSGGLLGANLIATFAVPSAEATNQTDESLFDFDKGEDSESSTSSSASESSSSSSSSKGGHHGGHSSTTSSSSEDSSTSQESESSSDQVEISTDAEKTSIEVSLKDYDGISYCLVKAELAYLSDLRSWMAEDSSGNVGVNIKQDFEDLINDAAGDVILAIDGDFPFWSTSRKGYVIRNGVSYRTTQRSDGEDDLAIFKDGSFMVYNEADYDFDTIYNMNGGCYQNWSFGPSLIKNGEISVEVDEEISGKSMSANQRTAMGITEDGKFYFLASEVDGSRQNGTGLSLYEVASILQDNGCVAAYNFDGGGSSALYYKVDGKGYYFNEGRDLGDIVYVVA